MGLVSKLKAAYKAFKEGDAIRKGVRAAAYTAEEITPEIAKIHDKQRVLVEGIEAALNPRNKTLGESAKEAASSVGNLRKGTGPNLSGAANSAASKQDTIAEATKELRQHISSEDYGKLKLMEGDLKPQEALDALYSGYRISPESFRALNKQLSTGTLVPTSGLKKAAIVGAVAVASAGIYNGLESQSDQNDNNLSFGERIVYNGKKFWMGITGYGQDTWVTNALNKNPGDRIAVALKGNIDKNIADAQESGQTKADTNRALQVARANEGSVNVAQQVGTAFLTGVPQVGVDSAASKFGALIKSQGAALTAEKITEYETAFRGILREQIDQNKDSMLQPAEAKGLASSDSFIKLIEGLPINEQQKAYVASQTLAMTGYK